MSKGKRNRESRADRKAAIAKATSGPVEFVQFMGADYDAYLRGGRPGGALVLVPSLWSGPEPTWTLGVLARRIATLTGRCPACGTSGDSMGEHSHEDRCPATDDNIVARMREYGVKKMDEMFTGSRMFDPDPTSEQLDGRELWVMNKSQTERIDTIRLARAA